MATLIERLRPLFWGGLLLVAAVGLVVRDRINEGEPWEAAAWAVLGGLLLLLILIPRRGTPQLLPWTACATFGALGYIGWLGAFATPVRVAGFVVATTAMVAMLLLPRRRRSPSGDDAPIKLDLE